ncbi:P-loop containing nucleoside triphosphate hydrolase protein [Phlyctochytrium arcticum]|nr:P-loop containing nucleoside triphosphate hydrolase protein [Phlyctochytrium arcticum]
MWIVKDIEPEAQPTASVAGTTVDAPVEVASKTQGKKRQRQSNAQRKAKNKKQKKAPAESPIETTVEDNMAEDNTDDVQDPMHVNAKSIPWKSIGNFSDFVSGDDQAPGGFLGLEEIDGVDVEFEIGAGGGKMVKFRTSKTLPKEVKPEPVVQDVHEIYGEFQNLDDFTDAPVAEGKKAKKGKRGQDVLESEPSAPTLKKETRKEKAVKTQAKKAESSAKESASLEEPVKEAAEHTDAAPQECEEEPEFDISAWRAFGFAEPLIQGIQDLRFSTPTEIQSKVIPVALSGKRDIIGAAQTGSGKTLAFGLPILQHIALRGKSGKTDPPAALILTPTRELAMQVTNHLNAVSKHVGAKIVSLVGGMSVAKQKRLLGLGPDIIVATPGRLWELASEEPQLMQNLRDVKYLAIDEADRMLEGGHFKELENILTAISWKREDCKASRSRRTLLFSATLVEHDGMKQNMTKKQKNSKPNGPSMNDLLRRMEFRDTNPFYVNIISDKITSDTLMESKIDCTMKDKDSYLYYILSRYPGRTIVFVNSIDAIRRLVPVLGLMNIVALPLHAELQQRQRLRNLDRFRENPEAVLIASDVAARGLDIPHIEHVVHYQLPRSADLYVHRSGRTARASSNGVSVMLCSPQEVTVYKKICHVLNKDDGIPEFPVDLSIFSAIKTRLTLAQNIDELEHLKQKTKHEESWFRNAAEEADIVLDEDFLESVTDKKGGAKRDAERDLKNQQKVKKWKQQLAVLLATPLMAKGISGKYLTSNVNSGLANDMMKAEGQQLKMPTQPVTSAFSDLQALR